MFYAGDARYWMFEAKFGKIGKLDWASSSTVEQYPLKVLVSSSNLEGLTKPIVLDVDHIANFD